jgi:hypothetical protein
MRILFPILGSAVHWEAKPIPRVVAGVVTLSKRQLSVPDKTEVLRDKQGSIIGWVLFDTDGADTPDNQIVCAAVSLWRRSGPPVTPFGSVHEFDYMSEENVDVLALQVRGRSSTTYERVGRGRIVKKGWLATCSKGEVLIW